MEICSIALDPIEKKPLARFYPGSRILSVGGVGCTLHCPWCQNHEIALPEDPSAVPTRTITPDELAEAAASYIPYGNIGVAYTYNEPLLRWRQVLECAKAVRAQEAPDLVGPDHLVNVLVTNGMVGEGPLEELLEWIDAWNIDLKAFTQEGYDVCGGKLDVVKRTIRRAAACSHVEVTTLVIPGYNDDMDGFERAAAWLADVDPDLTWHLSRFHPAYRWMHLPRTPLDTLYRVQEIARRHLNHVVLGNVPLA
ncbi:radical SAM protein [Slackia heliotrinireducens]|uniref:radical SAM protein n=1 Tax=Slackia heliotrinireducens TaxID=84110 RepID=UPI0033159A5B